MYLIDVKWLGIERNCFASHGNGKKRRKLNHRKSGGCFITSVIGGIVIMRQSHVSHLSVTLVSHVLFTSHVNE